MVTNFAYLVASNATTLIGGGADQTGLSGSGTLASIIKTITSTLFWGIGVVAVLMVIYGGIQIITSQGDPAKFKTGRLTITYAVAGIVVAIASYAIVNFVLANIHG